jgi:hypothetical protein
LKFMVFSFSSVKYTARSKKTSVTSYVTVALRVFFEEKRAFFFKFGFKLTTNVARQNIFGRH